MASSAAPARSAAGLAVGRAACPGSTLAAPAAQRRSTIALASSSVERADVAPSIEAIGAMSQAPRHSNARDARRPRSRRRRPASSMRLVARCVGAAQRARDVRADVARRGCPTGSVREHVVEASPPLEVGRASAASRSRLARSPRASTSRARAGRRERRDRRRAEVRVAAPSSASISARSVVGHVDVVAGRGSPPGRLRSRSAGARPSRGTREPCAKPRTGASGRSRSSAVDPPEDRVEHRERRDQVGDVAVLAPCRGAPAGSRSEGSRMCTRAGFDEPSATHEAAELAARATRSGSRPRPAARGSPR